MKVVINKQYGGFGLSLKGTYALAAKKGISITAWKQKRDAERHLVFGEYEEGECSFCTFYTTDGKPPGEDGENYFSTREEARDDADLVAVVEDLGDEVNGQCATLKIIEIPDGTDYTVEEYDGMEWIAEKHETWG